MKKFELNEWYAQAKRLIAIAETVPNVFILPIEDDNFGNLNFGVTTREHEIFVVNYGGHNFAYINGDSEVVYVEEKEFKVLVEQTEHFITRYKLQRSIAIEKEKQQFRTSLFNKEILSNLSTHFDKFNKRFVKVFTSYKAYRPTDTSFTAIIMSGESEGLGTTVNAVDLIKL